MNETNYRQLAREIAEFCKERLKPSAAKPTGGKSILHSLLVTALAITFSTMPDGDKKRSGW